MNISKIKEWLKLNRNKVIGVAFILIVLTVAFLSGEKPASVNTEDDKSTENELQSNATSDKVENRYTVKNSNSSDNINQTDNNANTDVSDSNSEAQDTSAYNDNSKSDNQNGEQNPGLNSNTSQDTDNSAEAKSDSNKTDTSSPGTNISDGSNEQNTNGNTSTSNNSGNNQNGNTNSDTGSNSGKNENTCTISISCATILNNMSILDKDKKDIVPKDGWILKERTVTFKEGESVFDILKRVCKDNKIHMEASFTPLYNSSYIEGIYNLYEFDCGSSSGWMYSVNGVFPNFGCSKYIVEKGDVIRWQYTCDLGKDIGGGMN